MGTKISAPAQPTASGSVSDWAKSLPSVYETQLKYAPLEAAQQVELAQQYAQPLGEAYLAAQKAMYPEEYALRNDLMNQAQEGMTSDVPDWMKQAYRDEVNANLGTNVGSGIGADYVSRGLLQQKKDWQDYYRNVAMSLSGTQPIYQAQSPSYSNYMSGYTPNSVMGFNAQNYGTYAQAKMQAQQANAMMPFMYMSGVGNLMRGVGGMASGFGWGEGGSH